MRLVQFPYVVLLKVPVFDCLFVLDYRLNVNLSI